MTTYRQIDEPAPTIVGPRPAEGAGGRMKIPQGLERLLTLAGISAEWRGKVLADPPGAAAEARIELSASERAILKSVPRSTIEGMAASFARKHGGSSLGRLVGAAAATAAALLVTGTAYGEESPGAKGGARADLPPDRISDTPLGGIRPDVPEEAGPVLWMTALDDALAQAKKSNRAVMAVFMVAKPFEEHTIQAVRGAMAYRATVGEQSQQLIFKDSKELRGAVKSADLVAVKLAKPAKPREFTKDDTAEQIAQLEAEHKAYEKASKVYEEAFKKYALDEKKLPAVVWLAPDGSELSKVVQPDDEAVFVKLIREVPPQLAKWVTEQRKHQPPPDAEGGIRPDLPPTRGIRPDVP